jgi:hypothetical protein
MEWEVSLSNGENWTNKQWSTPGDRYPFRRLIDYMVKKNAHITSCKVKIGNQLLHLPNFIGSKWDSDIIPEKYWYCVQERFAGGIGGQLKSVELWESISYRVDNKRIFYWTNKHGNWWIQETPLNTNIKEAIIDAAYGG